MLSLPHLGRLAELHREARMLSSPRMDMEELGLSDPTFDWNMTVLFSAALVPIGLPEGDPWILGLCALESFERPVAVVLATVGTNYC